MPSFFRCSFLLGQTSRGPGVFAVAAVRVSSFPPVSLASGVGAAVVAALDAFQPEAECAAAAAQLAAAEVRVSVGAVASVADDSVPGDSVVPLAVEPQADDLALAGSAALPAVELVDDSAPDDCWAVLPVAAAPQADGLVPDGWAALAGVG